MVRHSLHRRDRIIAASGLPITVKIGSITAVNTGAGRRSIRARTTREAIVAAFAMVISIAASVREGAGQVSAAGVGRPYRAAR